MSDKPQLTKNARLFKAVMWGFAAGSATFLLCRWGLKLGMDPSLIVSGFVGFALGTYLVQQVLAGKQ
ncbi:MAG: hypothetical protein AB7O43_06220 [Hyphomicrobiaceae bacterium]